MVKFVDFRDKAYEIITSAAKIVPKLLNLNKCRGLIELMKYVTIRALLTPRLKLVSVEGPLQKHPIGHLSSIFNKYSNEIYSGVVTKLFLCPGWIQALTLNFYRFFLHNNFI